MVARASHISLLVVAVIHSSYLLVPTLLLSQTSFGIFLTASASLATFARPHFRNTDHKVYLSLRLLAAVTGSLGLAKVLFASIWLSKLMEIGDGKDIYRRLSKRKQEGASVSQYGILCTLQWLTEAWNTFSGPQLFVNVSINMVTNPQYCYECHKNARESLFGIPLQRPAFRERLKDPTAPAPIRYWLFCLAKTPISAAFKFLTQVTCPRYFAEDDCSDGGGVVGPFHGTVYSFLPQQQHKGEEIVEELRNIFKEAIHPDMRATYANDEKPHTIEYLDIVHFTPKGEEEDLTESTASIQSCSSRSDEGDEVSAFEFDNDTLEEVERRKSSTTFVSVNRKVTRADPDFEEHLERLELTRYLHDFAGIHLLVHIWFEDYIGQAEALLHPADPLLRHFQSLATAGGYMASVGPFAFDADMNKIGEHFRMKEHTYLEGFDVTKCDHFNADVLSYAQNNKIASCRVTTLYAKAFREWATSLVARRDQEIPADSRDAVQKSRVRLLWALNTLHQTNFTDMEGLITNQLLLMVQHSLVHTVSYKRQWQVDGGSYATSFPPVHTYLFTLESVMLDLPYKEELRRTFLPPKDVEYGIQE